MKRRGERRKTGKQKKRKETEEYNLNISYQEKIKKSTYHLKHSHHKLYSSAFQVLLHALKQSCHHFYG